MNDPYKLTVITVNRNNEAGLKKTILSVINQSFSNYEYIIIDGASTDNSVNVIKEYESHIHYWVSEPDSGIYNAMNKAIQKAQGEYLIFMNSGDYFVEQNTLSRVFSKEQTDDLLVGAIIKDWKRIKERRALPKKITFYNMRFFYAIPHQSSFIKKSLFLELGLYDETKLNADARFALLAVFKYNKSILNLKQDIAIMDVSGISNSPEGSARMRKETEDMFRENFPYFYDDYNMLYKKKRFTFFRLKRHIGWRIRSIANR